ncbi:MAG: hypothetical protein ACLQVI_12220 [Polyangiaceae bacterium]
MAAKDARGAPARSYRPRRRDEPLRAGALVLVIGDLVEHDYGGDMPGARATKLAGVSL